MKSYIKTFIVLACSLGATAGFMSCVDESYDLDRAASDGKGLFLVIGGLGTRATGAEFTEAEKLVKSIDLFFYSATADDETAPVYYMRTNVAMDSESSGTNQITSNKGKIRLTMEPEELFPNGATSLRVYAAVNVSETEDASTLTIGQLKDQMTTSSDWIIKEYLDENGNLSTFEGFAMFTNDPNGDQVTLSYDEDGKAVITGIVKVDKLMSKIDLFVGFGPSGENRSIDDWTITAPDPNNPSAGTREWKVYRPSDSEKQPGDESVFGDEMEVFIVNGVNTARLGGAFEPDGTFIPKLTEDNYFDLWDIDEGSSTNDFMNYAHGVKDNPSTASSAAYPYMVEAPFYTYPNSWTDGLLNTDTHLILKVNWVPVDGNPSDAHQELVETYYKVPLNKTEGTDQNKIISNKHYSVKVKINTLGGLHFGEPIALDDCSFEVIPWNNIELDAKLRETRYLEVRQDVVDRDGTHYTAVMNNVQTISIPFYSSHKVEIREARIRWYDFLQTQIVNEEVIPTNRDTNISSAAERQAFTITEDLLDSDTPGVFIDEINSRIIIQHQFHPIELKNNASRYNHVTSTTSTGSGSKKVYTHKDPYSPFDIYIELKHKNYMDTDPSGQDFKLDKIYVRQYPARYIEPTFNPGGGKEGTWGFEKKYGHVLVNNSRSTLGNVGGIDAGFFTGIGAAWFGVTDNPVMYVVNVTTLSDEDLNPYPLHLGDPRMLYISNDLWTQQEKTGSKGISNDHYTYEPLSAFTENTADASWSVEADTWVNHQAGSSRKMRFYYPTNETPVNEYRYMVSPRFRIASSYGNASQAIGRVRARKRCASYQEDRYPAGRWRLPTPGEMFYMVQLSQLGIIPELFSDEPYWTSHGLYKIGTRSVTEQKAAEGIFSGRETANGENSTTSGNYVIKGYTRCVYDEWYWQDYDGTPDIITTAFPSNNGKFYWGDKVKDNPQNQNR